MNLKLSLYNQYLQKENSLMVFNGVTRGCVEFENTTQDTLLEKIFEMDGEKVDLLENVFMIVVPAKRNEFEYYINKFHIDRISNTIDLTIGFTLKCNFNCIYCIQKENYSNREHLTEEGIDEIIKWIEPELRNGIERINVNFFGGEPTLNLNSVYRFSEKLNSLQKVLNFKKYYQFVTNGFALKEESIKKLTGLGIRDYQITLDGLFDDHNKRRSPKIDSFSRIVNNIILLLEHNALVFLLNVFDMSNSKTPAELVDYFEELLKGREHLKDRIVFNFAPTIPKQVESVLCNKYVEGHELFLNKEAIKAFHYAKNKGFDFVKFIDIGMCTRQIKNFIMIDPELKAYKCYSSFGNDRYSFGKITDKTFTEMIESMECISLANGITSECSDCSVLPFCRGGCQFMASERNDGEYGHQFCEKNTILEQVKTFMHYDLY